MEEIGVQSDLFGHVIRKHSDTINHHYMLLDGRVLTYSKPMHETIKERNLRYTTAN